MSDTAYSTPVETIAAQVEQLLGERARSVTVVRGEVTLVVAAAAVEALFDKQVPAALCTHRPALPTVLKQLGRHMGDDLRSRLPGADPYLSPGEVIVCHVARGSERKVVSVEQFKPFDD